MAAWTGHGVAAIIGMAESCDDNVYITQVICNGGGVAGHYRKRTLGEGEEAYHTEHDKHQPATLQPEPAESR